MSGAHLLDPVPHVDPAHSQGALIADNCITAIRAGVSDPDALMRVLMRLIADNGTMVPPTSLLRGFCCAVQREIREAGHDDAS